MSIITKCPSCLGRKKLIGFGFIEEPCQECKGVGSVEKDQEVKPNVVMDAVGSDEKSSLGEIIKKKGRPKKDKDKE